MRSCLFSHLYSLVGGYECSPIVSGRRLLVTSWWRQAIHSNLAHADVVHGIASYHSLFPRSQVWEGYYLSIPTFALHKLTYQFDIDVYRPSSAREVVGKSLNFGHSTWPLLRLGYSCNVTPLFLVFFLISKVLFWTLLSSLLCQLSLVLVSSKVTSAVNRAIDNSSYNYQQITSLTLKDWNMALYHM